MTSIPIGCPRRLRGWSARIVRHMVGRWGMSPKLGLMALLPEDGAAYHGEDVFSQRTRELFDEEVRRIVDDAHQEVTALLREERERLDALAEALLERETLDEVDAYAAAGILRPERSLVG